MKNVFGLAIYFENKYASEFSPSMRGNNSEFGPRLRDSKTDISNEVHRPSGHASKNKNHALLQKFKEDAIKKIKLEEFLKKQIEMDLKEDLI